jgi:hypothetical protein
MRYKPLRHMTALLCAYEAFAIEADLERCPTLSRVAGSHRWFAPTLLAMLAVHLWWPVSK